MPKVLIAVVGPTAIGKTSWAITLAKHFNAEIFSADSRQFFQEMHIGTAVPSPEELKSAKHHFIQHRSIFDPYSVGDFEREAIQALETYFKKNDIAILVGGSGLYVNAILYGLDNFPTVPKKIREQLNSVLKKKGIAALQRRLKSLDPEYYAQVDLENPHRLIRALEVGISSGKPYSSYLGTKKNPRNFKPILIGLNAERKVIYDRINKRVEDMMLTGLLQEAKTLHAHKSLNALNTVGYKELFDYLEGKMTLDMAVEEIKKNTRRFAKRQLTWYRKNEEILWLDYDLPEKEFIVAIEEPIKKLLDATL